MEGSARWRHTVAVADDATVMTRWADRHPMRWKNGGGVTRELAAFPPGADASEFVWRVSIADVDQPGPFSAYPGVDRVITLLEGDAMVLTLEAGEKVLRPREPFRFSGEDAVTCALPGGPTRDLNVMTRRGQASAEVRVHQTDTAHPVEGGSGRLLVVALDDDVRLVAGSGQVWVLGRYDLVDTAETVSAGPGCFAVIRIS